MSIVKEIIVSDQAPAAIGPYRWSLFVYITVLSLTPSTSCLFAVTPLKPAGWSTCQVVSESIKN